MTARTVLIVDDNVVNLELYAELMDLTEYRAVLVEEADAVLPAARQEAPGLVLLDLTLPKSSGFEVAAELKSDPATAGIPIIAVTAALRDRLVEDLRQAGFIGLLPKPCGVDTFLDAVAWGMEEAGVEFRLFG